MLHRPWLFPNRRTRNGEAIPVIAVEFFLINNSKALVGYPRCFALTPGDPEDRSRDEKPLAYSPIPIARVGQ
jgi:hypothetical protein